MSKVLCSVGLSLDGFIAGPGGDMSWLTAHLGPNPAVDELIGDVGALLIGNRTFGGDDPHRGTEQEGNAFGGGWTGPMFVLTHRPPAEPVQGITFVGDLESAIDASMSAGGERYVNILGADVAHQRLEAGRLDEVLVCIAPVLLGDGVRLFHHPAARSSGSSASA